MYFPLFFSMEDKKVVVVGAGSIAQRRIQSLLPFGAKILVVAPETSMECRHLFATAGVTFLEKEYQKEVLEGAFFVLACTSDATVNEKVVQDARKLGILANRCDKKEDCDFYFPGIARRGELVAGITAGGRNHRLAKEATKQVQELWEQAVDVCVDGNETEKKEI